MSRKRPLTEDEKRLWKQVAKTVKPLRKHLDEEEEEDIAPVKATPPKKPVVSEPAPLINKRAKSGPIMPLSRGHYAGIDHRTADKFRKGNYEIDAALDLHGFTQVRAHEALRDFVRSQHRQGSRCLLVITGKGLKKESTGVLREKLPQWLDNEDLRPMVLAFDAARPHHGGDGAFYILLKRTR